MNMIINFIFLLFLLLILYLFYKIPFINRISYNIWKKHWEIIVTIVIALFVSLVIMPRLMK